MMPHSPPDAPSIARTAMLAALFALTVPVSADSVRGSGGLLPIQDQVGAPRVAAAVEDALREALAQRHELVDPQHLRDAQRRLRLRDTSQAPPAALARLGRQVEATWLFSATLHEVGENRPSRAEQANTGVSATSIPTIVISGRAVSLSGPAPSLGWAGFEAASGLDERRLLGLGVVTELEQLAADAARRLAEAFEQGRAQPLATSRPARGGYLRRPIDAGATVAVVPFHSVTERGATIAGDTVTELALAVLFDAGFEVMLPGAVHEILRRHGNVPRGEVDASVRADLSQRGAELIMTGAVEAWESRGRGEPEPRVGLAARLLDASSGAILWWNGDDRRGWDRSRVLGLGRVYASGALAQEMMASLLAGALASPKRAWSGGSESGAER